MADFLRALFGTEMSGTAAFAFTLVAVLAALTLLYMLVRSMRSQRFVLRTSAEARLAVTEIVHIDDRHKLVLVRRDDVEHLVMIGGARDVVIEHGIQRKPDDEVEPVNATAEAESS